MDTIRMKMKIVNTNGEDRDLSPTEIDKIERKAQWIKSFKKSKGFDEYTCGVILPKVFSKSNATLIGTKKVEKFKKYILREFLGSNWRVKEATIQRVDIPFTYWMGEEDTFHDYRNLFYALTAVHSKAIGNSPRAGKNFEDTLTRAKESYIFTDSTNTNKYNYKIQIYNQDKKMQDYDSSSGKGFYKKVLKEHPDLPQRIRIEISRKTNIDLKKMTYEDQAKKSYKYLIENLFNEDLLDEVFKEEVSRLYELLKKARSKSSFNFETFLYRHKPLSYDCLKSATKKAYKNENSYKSAVKKFRSIIKNNDELSHLLRIKPKKVIAAMKKEFKKQLLK